MAVELDVIHFYALLASRQRQESRNLNSYLGALPPPSIISLGSVKGVAAAAVASLDRGFS
jgi:hypothetical protein